MGLGFRVLVVGVQSSGFKVQSYCCRGSELWVQGSEFWV